MSRAVVTALVLTIVPMLAAPQAASAAPAPAPPPGAAVEAVVADYIGLYARGTLERWKTLFHPAVVVASPGADGAITVRNLDEFYERQRSYFATGRRISERLENVTIAPGRRLARVNADFIFSDEGEESRGRLGLHLAEGKEGWKITAVLFAYDEE